MTTSNLAELSGDVRVAKEAAANIRKYLAGGREQAETILQNLSGIGLEILQDLYGSVLDEIDTAIEINGQLEAQMHKLHLAVQGAGG